MHPHLYQHFISTSKSLNLWLQERLSVRVYVIPPECYMKDLYERKYLIWKNARASEAPGYSQ